MIPPRPRGASSAYLLENLASPSHEIDPPVPEDDPLEGDDFHLVLYLCYELHYGPTWEIDPRWEWEPSMIGFRRSLEDDFERALRSKVGSIEGAEDVPGTLRTLAASKTGISLPDHLQVHAGAEQLTEFLIHRSAYHLMEADPHTWAIPRLRGRAKAAMVEIQADEYGAGDPTRMHSQLFADAMEACGLESQRGYYVDLLPGVTLATVNLMSMFGLNRRLRGAAVGHLALFEMTSTEPNRKYAHAFRRVGYDNATGFFDEHVEADAVHEQLAAHDLAGALASEDPELADDILFGANALMKLDEMWAARLLAAWHARASSLFRQEPHSLAG